MVFYTFRFTILLENGQKKKMMMFFWGKQAEEKQNSATIMITVDEKATVSPVKSKLQGE